MDRYHEDPEQIRMDFHGFEMGRGEFFAHTREPWFTLNDGKVQANTACIRKMKDVDYIQILINQMTHKLVIRACEEEELFSLPPEDRMVIHLHYYEGYSTDEIARIVGQRPGTVRSRLSRARQRLKKLMEG